MNKRIASLVLIIVVALAAASLMAAIWVSGPTHQSAATTVGDGWTWDDGPNQAH